MDASQPLITQEGVKYGIPAQYHPARKRDVDSAIQKAKNVEKLMFEREKQVQGLFDNNQ